MNDPNDIDWERRYVELAVEFRTLRAAAQNFISTCGDVVEDVNDMADYDEARNRLLEALKYRTKEETDAK